MNFYKKNILVLCLIYLFSSCDFIEKLNFESQESKASLVASVNDNKLLVSELKQVFPTFKSSQDSLVLVKGYINTWAKQKILLEKAKENISEVHTNEIESLVENYRQSLYVNGYKERLIKQQLDTIISSEEIEQYYDTNKDNFRLTSDILRFKYVFFANDLIDKKNVIKKFKSDKEEDLSDLELNLLSFKDYHLRDSSWVTIDFMIKKIPAFTKLDKSELLKNSKFIQKQDSLGVYLVAVNDILKRNDVAPLVYVNQKIKKLILYKRKKELVRKIEKTLLDDAIKNNTFKTY